MGGYGGDAQVHVGVPPPVGAPYHRDDREAQGRQRVGVPLSSGGNGSRGASPHGGVHQEARGDHSGKGAFCPICGLCT